MALLLALLLPLQAFAAVSGCAQVGVTHMATHAHCDPSTPNPVHHDCGSCCYLAAAGNPAEITPAPRADGSQPTLARPKIPPSSAHERLDRPPRFQFT